MPIPARSSYSRQARLPRYVLLSRQHRPDPHRWDSTPRLAKNNWSAEDNQLLRDLVGRGHEIGAHSVHHRHPFLDADPKVEAEGSREWIESRIGKPISSYCYPFYYITSPIKNAVINAGYKQARGGPRGSYYPQSPSDWFDVDCRQIAKNENVGGWIRPNCWHVLTYHGIGDEHDGWEPITIAEFDRQMAELVKYRDACTVEVVTFKDVAERLRQPIS